MGLLCVTMKNGDVNHPQSYEWDSYAEDAELSSVIGELEAHATRCMLDHPGQQVCFTFDSSAGAVPQPVRAALERLGAKVDTWP
jgi:hypothetical protein